MNTHFKALNAKTTVVIKCKKNGINDCRPVTCNVF